MKGLKAYANCLIDPTFASSAVRVALIVGSVLFALNHGTAAIAGKMTFTRWLSGGLTYMVPYMVNVHGQYSSRDKRQQEA